MRTGDGKIAGTAFFISETLALTCYHVVRDVLAPKRAAEGDALELDLTHLRNTGRRQSALIACVHEDDDVCLLRLANDARRPAGTTQLRLAQAVAGADRPFVAYGYPVDRYALPTRGIIVGGGNSGVLLLSGVDAEVTITKGYSGAPVYDTKLDRAVGLIINNVGGTAIRRGTGLAVPVSTIHAVCPLTLEAGEPREIKVPSLKRRLQEIARKLRPAVKAALKFEAPPRSPLPPDIVDDVEIEQVRGYLAVYFAAWSTRHTLNRDWPDDGDFFYVVSFEGEEADFPDPDQLVATIAIEWSERGVRAHYEGRYGRTLTAMIARWAKALKRLRIEATIDEGDWSGIQIRTTHVVSAADPEASAGEIATKIYRLAKAFETIRASDPKD